MDLDLGGKVVFVAGSSRGIGYACAMRFVEEGANIVITGRNPDRLKRAEDELLTHADRSDILALQGDMTGEVEIDAALKAVKNKFGCIDAVIANVGDGAGTQGIDISKDEWAGVFDRNLHGSMALAKYAVPYLRDRECASFTFISSIAGIEALNAPIPYAAAKAGLMMGMKSLARTYATEDVRFNSVAPGNILFPGGSWSRKLEEDADKWESMIQKEVPMRRFGKPGEIADAVVFLASKRASFITGAVLVVDGGQSRSL